MKGVSPLVAVVLLIAFSVAVGIILGGWVTGLTKTQTGYVEEKGEKQVQCTFAGFKVTSEDVVYNFSASSPTLNVTIYNNGDEPLYNFTFYVITDYEINPKTYVFKPENQKTINSPLRPAETYVFKCKNATSDIPTATESFDKLRIVALCKKTFKVAVEVNIE
jgi:archaellum component FlaF (FlaF/FlaG flagellin family)